MRPLALLALTLLACDARDPSPPVRAPSSAHTAQAAPQSTIPIDTCTPSHEDHDGEYRSDAKHRAPDLSARPTPARALSSIGWTAADEGSARTLDGDAWRIKLDPGDCDIHIEMSDPGASASDGRVIVEVPNDAPYRATRHALDAAYLAATGKHIGTRGFDLPRPIPLRATGFAFSDGAHRCRDLACPHPSDAHCSHGTRFVCGVWEVHPAWSVTERKVLP